MKHTPNYGRFEEMAAWDGDSDVAWRAAEQSAGKAFLVVVCVALAIDLALLGGAFALGVRYAARGCGL